MGRINVGGGGKISPPLTAEPSDVLMGRTFSKDGKVILTGIMPNRGVFNLGLGANVPAGYYSGGSVPSGKRFATGVLEGGGTFNITGLGFTPNIVIYYSESAPGNLSNYGINLRNAEMQYQLGAVSYMGRNLIATGNPQQSINTLTFNQASRFSGNDFTISIQTFGGTNRTRWYAFE